MAKRAKPTTPLNELALDILSVLKTEFVQSGRTTAELLKGYAGMSMADLQSRFLDEGSISRVDYDLALKSLEDRSLVSTGPTKMYENDPNSSAMIIGFYSKREFIFLKEAGYQMAVEKPKAPRPAAPRQTVNITGGNFYQSPITSGEQISQQISFDPSNQNDTVNYLIELLAKEGFPASQQTKTEVIDMVAKANEGDMKAAKPILQRIFGGISEPAKEIASGVIAGIVTKSLGL